MVKEEDIVISRSFQDLCRFYSSNFEKVHRLDGEMNKYDREGKDFLKDPETLLSNRNVAPIDIFAHSKKLNINVKKAHIAYEVIFMIRNSFEDIRRVLHKYAIWMREPEQIRRFEEVGIQANTKNITRPAKIVYAFSKEEKLSSYDDHIEILQDDLLAEKDARAILESSINKGTFILTYNNSEKLEQSTIQTTKSKTSNKEKEKRLSEEFTEIEEKGHRIPTSASIDSQVDEAININIFSDKEIKPRHKAHEDYDYQIERENINMILRNPVTDAYEYTYAKSEVVKRRPKERIIKKTKSNIFPRIESIKALEMRREITELRRKNKELTAKLEAKQLKNSFNLDQTTFTTNAKGKPAAQLKESLEPDKNLLIEHEKFTKHYKYPTTLKQHFPLKNWNLILKKTVSCDQKQKLYCIEPATDLEFLITGSNTGKLIFWRYGNFINITEHKIIDISQSPITSLLYLNDRKTLLCGCNDGTLYLIDLTVFTAKPISNLKSSINSIVYIYNGSTILAASGNKIYEIDISNERILNHFEAHDMDITDLAYNYKKDILSSASNDKTIKLWNPKTKECLGVLRGHAKEIKSICFAFSLKHFYIVSCARDSYVTFWNLTDKNMTRTVKMNSVVKKVIYLHDKKTILIVNKNGSFVLWNLNKTEDKKEISFQKFGYLSAAYYDDGYNIVLGSKDGSLEFWNAVADDQTVYEDL